jgi:mediator of RNA polymerase II transcription subunit 13
VQGPLTWRQFHRLAVCGTGQCEPQPIPSVIVGHEKDLLCLAPYAIQYWDKLLLEPYAYPRDIAYIIVAPDNDYVVSRLKIYFKELSTTYEMCKLGRHTPIKRWDNSILRVGKSTATSKDGAIDDWFNSLGDGQTSELLRLYAQACQYSLAPLLAKIPTDKSILDPPDLFGSGTNGGSVGKDRPLPSPMPPPSTPDPSQPGDKAPVTPKSEQNDSTPDTKDVLNSSGGSTSTPSSSSQQSTPILATPALSTDSFKRETDEVQPPHVVIYLVEPFTCGSDSPDLQRLACLALLRCYSNILQSIPESVRNNISIQVSCDF